MPRDMTRVHSSCTYFPSNGTEGSHIDIRMAAHATRNILQPCLMGSSCARGVFKRAPAEGVLWDWRIEAQSLINDPIEVRHVPSRGAQKGRLVRCASTRIGAYHQTEPPIRLTSS